MMRIEKSLRLAELSMTQGKLSQALNKCKQVLAEQPNCAKAYIIIGQVWEIQGNIKQSMFAFTKALEIEPELAETHAYLAQLYSQQKWFEEAISQYQKAIDLGIKWPEVYYNLGHILHQLGDLEQAVHLHKQAIALNPNYINAYLSLGVIFNLQGNYELAIDIYRKIITLNPEFIEAYNNLGCILAQIDKIDEAISIYQEGISIKPDGANLYNNLGHALFKRSPEKAIAAYHHAIELEPNLALAHYNLGKTLQSINQHELAIEYFQKVIKLEPNNVLAYSDCGFSLMTIGKLEKAMICFEKVVADNEFINAYCQSVETRLLPVINQESDDIDCAKVVCAQFLRKLQILGGKKLQELGEKDEKLLEEIEASLCKIYVDFGNILMKDGSYETAESYYQKALQIQPENPEIYYRLGNSLVQQERLSAAIIVYQVILGKLPTKISIGDRIGIYFELGKILEKQKRWESAIEYYSKALSLQLEWERGKKNLNKSILKVPGCLKNNSSYLSVKNPEGLYLYAKDWVWGTDQDSKNYIEVFLTVQEKVRTDKKSLKITPTYKNQRPECNGLNCSKCLWKIHQWFEPKYLGLGIYICTEEKKRSQKLGFAQLQKAAQNPTFVTIIPEGKAWIMPQQSYWQLCHAIAIISPDNYLLADVSREYPSPLPGCEKHDPSKHQVFLEKLPPLEQIDGKVAVLSSLSGNVYFHWMVDLLPRIEILRRGVDLEEIDWFVVNNNQQAFQQETLKALGIPEKKILASDRHPYIQAKELVVPAFASYLGWLQPWGLKFLREVFLTEKILSKSGFPERIYVSRDNARYRRVFNEMEVREMLGMVGFVTVTPEAMSLENQIATFAHAKIIVAPHGSGLTNIVFCNSGAKVIELFSPHYLRYYYWQISELLGLEHYYLTGEAFSCYPLRQLMYESALTEDIMVNLGSLKQMLKVVGIKS